MPNMPTAEKRPLYITTPIYYVNDRPHIGHCYTTLVGDVAARMARLIGRDVFFLTGTDEHAEKVVASASQRGLTPIQWADQNAAEFRAAFKAMNFSNDDFVRTTEERHITRASAYIEKLVKSGDIALGDYEGWWDASQEEYLTETVAKENDFKSPVTKKPLERRTEKNYFFDLPKYEARLRRAIESGEIQILPEQRKNEVLGRIKTGLQRVPVSRAIKPGDADWGIKMPGDPNHRVYVWIEALCNYLTVVDTPERRTYWPQGSGKPNTGEPLVTAPIVHFMAKDILWFHAVIWPAMLMALGEPVPKTVYAHAYFVSEGVKMSKSLGNFIEIDQLKAYADRYSLDAVRWYLATQGPLGATDADFAYGRFVEVYNADLANGIGNCASRVANMIEKYFEGSVPAPNWEGNLSHFYTADNFDSELSIALKARADAGKPASESDRLKGYRFPEKTAYWSNRFAESLHTGQLDEAVRNGIVAVQFVDEFISHTAPFTLAKRIDDLPGSREALGAILYACAEALRIASLMLYPAMPEKMASLWRLWNCSPLTDPDDCNSAFKAPLSELAQWAHPVHGLKPGQKIAKGDALFMRADPKEPAPTKA
ncbi:MAG: methionine--tRNA ligase [Phycisphaeraceae bacterium]|nr:MAG: methionine--tRNA ligase [Phycisphaeraceae bacterium]